jgi:hypothetical protein
MFTMNLLLNSLTSICSSEKIFRPANARHREEGMQWEERGKKEGRGGEGNLEGRGGEGRGGELAPKHKNQTPPMFTGEKNSVNYS